MNQHPFADGWKALLSLFAGPMTLVIGGLLLLLSIGFCAGARQARSDARLAAKIDTVRISDSVAVVRTDTVIVRQRRVDTVRQISSRLDSAVVIVNDSTVQTHDTVAVIPPLVVADLRALRITVATQDTLILSLYQRNTTRQWQIASRDKLIKKLSKPKCGKRCGFLLGITAGLLIHKAMK